MNWYIAVLKKYADFDGRARRSEFWWFNLISTLIYMVPYTILVVTMIDSSGDMDNGTIQVLSSILGFYGLAVFVPSLAVTVRRLHDTGRSGWNVLWSILPLIGSVILLIYFFTDSQPGANEYGPNPKNEGQEFELYEN